MQKVLFWIGLVCLGVSAVGLFVWGSWPVFAVGLVPTILAIVWEDE